MIDLPLPPLGPAATRAAERAAMGYCLAGHPTADPAATAATAAAGARTLASAGHLRSRDDRVTVAACCAKAYERRTKAGDWMAVLFLEDARTRAEAVAFPRTWADVADTVDEATATSAPLLLTLGASADGGLVVHAAAPLWPASAGATQPPLPLGDFIVVDVETCVGPPDHLHSGVRLHSGVHLHSGARDGQEGGTTGGPHQGSLGTGGDPPPGGGGQDVRRKTRAKKPAPGASDRAAGGGADAAAVASPPHAPQHGDRLDLSRLRIVEVGVALYVARKAPDGSTLPGGATHYLAAAHSALCAPGCPIDAESTAVHGITDADVRGQPTFAQRALALAIVLGAVTHTELTAAGASYRPRRTLVTYNGRRFDLPLLAAEFARAGLALSATPPAVLDPALSTDVYDHVRLRYRGRLDRPASKRLGDQCAFHKVPLAKAHRAAADAQATGALLLALRRAGWVP